MLEEGPPPAAIPLSIPEVYLLASCAATFFGSLVKSGNRSILAEDRGADRPLSSTPSRASAASASAFAFAADAADACARAGPAEWEGAV